MKKHKKSPDPAKGTCFVIMPFGGYFDTYFDDIYVPAIEKAGLCPTKADDLFRPSPIINDIWQFTKDARLVLADLSKKNPNVFYELGLAHSLSKPAILVTESIADVPFDLQSLRVLIYDKALPNWGAKLADSITNSIKEVLAAPQSAVLPTFLNVKDNASKPTVTSQEAEILQIKQEIAGLRRQLVGGGSEVPVGVVRRVDIGPRDAKTMIGELLRKGVPSQLIVDVVARLGPPRGWVEARIRALQEESSRQGVLSAAIPGTTNEANQAPAGAEGKAP
jgi:hypothetical protein